MIIFSQTLKDYVRHLTDVFIIFNKVEISINLRKTYLDYFTVQLLGQKVNSLELFISEKKLKIITLLQFSVTLKQLKTYLDLTEYLKNYISYYA